MEQKYTSALTSINSRKAPAIYSNPIAISYMRHKTVIDIGGGKYETAVIKAREYNASVSIYDKYNRASKHNAIVMRKQYDIAVISNVLNVIAEQDVRKEVILQASNKAPVVLITVYEGDKSGVGRTTKNDCWQENRRLVSYLQEVQEALPEKQVNIKNGLIIAR